MTDQLVLLLCPGSLRWNLAMAMFWMAYADQQALHAKGDVSSEEVAYMAKLLARPGTSAFDGIIAGETDTL